MGHVQRTAKEQKQIAHFDRRWMKILKINLQMNKKLREQGVLPSPNPRRLPA